MEIKLFLGKTSPITLKYKNHICKTEFYVVDLPSYCGILGTEWLTIHNPQIDFKNKEITFNSKYCLSNCLTLPNSFIINSNKINSQETSNPSHLNTNNSKFHSSNKISYNIFNNSLHNKSSYNISYNSLNNEKSSCNQTPSSQFPKSKKSFTKPVKISKFNNSCIKHTKISKFNSFCNNTSKSFKICNSSFNKPLHFQYSKSLNDNKTNFLKERVNSVNSVNSVINSILNFYENFTQFNQNFSFINPNNPNNQITKINNLLQIKKNNENHHLYFIIQNSKIAKVKKKYFHFKIFKYDSFLPYEDKPPENFNSLPYTFFK